jgi:hypothetical protein
MPDRLIFISCGQWRTEEKALGSAVADLINQRPSLKGYFVQNQSTLHGLTTEILGKLHACSAFVAIMHKRGTVDTPAGKITRASVWIEQEIAIAAYLKQVLKRHIEVKLFIEHGIALEGIREKLGINPMLFSSDDDVLREISRTLDVWQTSLKEREPETMLERIQKYQREQKTVTVKGELPDNPQLRLLGNKRWPGESQCHIVSVNDSFVEFFKLESSIHQSVPLKYLTESRDDHRHQPLFLVDATGG